MKYVKQKFNGKHIFTSVVAMESNPTEVPIVNVETAEKESAQDVNEDYWEGNIPFKFQLLCYKNMHCVFPLYVDRSWGTAACLTTPWGVLPSNRLMGICRWIEWNFHNRIEYNVVAFSTELLEWCRTFFGILGVRKL